jgi:hypothetical protein
MELLKLSWTHSGCLYFALHSIVSGNGNITTTSDSQHSTVSQIAAFPTSSNLGKHGSSLNTTWPLKKNDNMGSSFWDKSFFGNSNIDNNNGFVQGKSTRFPMFKTEDHFSFNPILSRTQFSTKLNKLMNQLSSENSSNGNKDSVSRESSGFKGGSANENSNKISQMINDFNGGLNLVLNRFSSIPSRTQRIAKNNSAETETRNLLTNTLSSNQESSLDTFKSGAQENNLDGVKYNGISKWSGSSTSIKTSSQLQTTPAEIQKAPKATLQDKPIIPQSHTLSQLQLSIGNSAAPHTTEIVSKTPHLASQATPSTSIMQNEHPSHPQIFMSTPITNSPHELNNLMMSKGISESSQKEDRKISISINSNGKMVNSEGPNKSSSVAVHATEEFSKTLPLAIQATPKPSTGIVSNLSQAQITKEFRKLFKL